MKRRFPGMALCMFLPFILFLPAGAEGEEKETDQLLAAMQVSQLDSGKEAPEFTLPDLGGKLVNLKDYRGKLVFLNFWATWCIPCKEELPSIGRLYNRFKDKGLEVLAVSIDTEKEDAVKEFLKDYDVDFAVLLDQDQFVRKELYHLMGIPTTFLIDREGKVIGMALGDRDWDKRRSPRPSSNISSQSDFRARNK